jgi:uncharacterized ferritin-like protein (DUF455 family)
MSLVQRAITVLETADCLEKCSLTFSIANDWRENRITAILSEARPPDVPARSMQEQPEADVKSNSKAPSMAGMKLVHALAHIESVAIDLAWDIIARFATDDTPRDFYSDWIKVAEDESRHFRMLLDRLEKNGLTYGSYPVHQSLWRTASETSGNLLARLAVVHCVLEARGLDINPKTMEKFKGWQDNDTVEVLVRINEDEITHVSAGVKWFNYFAEPKGEIEIANVFHATLAEHWKGKLVGPFNVEAREKAGLPQSWYSDYQLQA